jgi:hypothetical protein
MSNFSRSRPAPANAALDLKRHGIQPVLLKPHDKVPVHTGWQKQQLSEADIPALFTNASNVGAQYGPVSGGLVDAEFDSESARVLAPRFMPPNPDRVRPPIEAVLTLALSLPEPARRSARGGNQHQRR